MQYLNMENITAFCFHPAFSPPKSGGEEREYYLYYYLSRHRNITLITFMNKNDSGMPEYVQHTPSFLEIRVPKTNVTNYLYAIVNRFSSIVECSAVLCSIESIFNRKFKKIGSEYINNSGIIIFDYPYLCIFLKNALKRKKVLYHAHNNEYEMMQPTLEKGIVGKLLLSYVHFIEKRVIRFSDKILCVSESDIRSLSGLYPVNKKECVVIPNGVSLPAYDLAYNNRKPLVDPKVGIFIGSFHPPNISAISQIMKIAESTPDILYFIIGGASDYFINQRGLTQSSTIYPAILSSFSQILTVDGIYPSESWGDLSIVWTKPSFGLHCLKTINQVKILLYSVSNQVINNTSENLNAEILINSGWNTILFDVDGREFFEFTCSNSYCDEKRTLGVAISEISYCISGEWTSYSGGKIPAAIQCLKDHNNVILLGKVSEEEKLSIYQIANFAVNPMTEGSGTNLKVLGY
jgi:glycosyltransferase involved in cell wall biosynthesis